ncbi:MAG TPA: DEAD/DEAH box helicase, partial [Polyangiaceae bacterium]
LSRLAELRDRLARAASSAERARQAERARAELAALESESEATVAAVNVPEALSRELFVRAVAAREAWAQAHAEELVAALATAVRVVEQERSLRSLFRSDPEAARTLCRLFAIWGSTLLSLGNCFPADGGGIARVVIDEAGQCHPAHAVSALLRAEAALVIGDVHQLSPVIELRAHDEDRLLRSCRLATPAELLSPYRVHADATVSTQALADRAVQERAELTDHFRCQPEIIALSDALCDYGLTVHTPRDDRSRQAPYLRRPLSLIDLRGEQARLAGSWYNELELEETLALLESLLSGGIPLEEIAVITPYRGQLECLRRGFSQRRIALESSPELAEADGAGMRRGGGVALGTVHRFQGGERSIVLFSSVVTHVNSLAFLNARPNLLNVAISRAQHHFVCLGHAAVLARGPRSRLLVDGVSTLSPGSYRQVGIQR